LNIHCTRVYIKKYATYLSSCMVPDIISLATKNKKLDMHMNIYSMFKLTTKIDAPFYIRFTNAIISGSNRLMHFLIIRIIEIPFMLNSTCIIFHS